MNFDLGVEQTMLKKSAREFFAKEVDSALVRELEADEVGHLPKLWKKMARLGWMGLLIPEAHGGEEMSLLDMAVVLEQMGKSAFSSPFFFSAVVATLLIMEAGNEKQKKKLLPGMANGKKIATVAWQEENTGTSAVEIQTTAASATDGFVLNGTKLFVPYAHVADTIIVAARTKTDTQDADGGIAVFIVDAKAPGVSVAPIATTCGDKQCEVTLDEVAVGADSLMGPKDKGWLLLQSVFQKCAVAKCAEMIGGGDQVLKMTVDYAKQRMQFGKPIGSFQAVQHHCANMLMLLELSKATTYRTAWLVSEGKSCDQEMAMCKSWVSDSYRSLTALGIQVMGGFGCMEEADHQIYFRRAKAAEISFGDATYHREQVARQMGL
jgi:alkylation response protein AidB-like acyl-CoA dehydrogenase